MPIIRVMTILVASAFGAVAIAQTRIETVQSAYYVYCAAGKIEVDGRSPEEMRSARGADVCVLSRFGYLSDAQNFAQKNFGGAGKKCSCR